MVQNRLVLIIHFLRAQNEKILVYGAGAACFKAVPAASFRQAKKQGCGSGSAWIQEGKFVN